MVYKQGCTDKELVKRIQRVVGCSPVDGIWGAKTTEAVKVWQKAHGLVDDGLVGPATLAKMGVAPSSIIGIQHGKLFLKKSKRRIDYIAVHCTATPEGVDKSVQKIREEHIAQGWSDIGYHYVITRDGKIYPGRDVDLVGSHVAGYNSNSIGVVYVGGLEYKPGVAYNKLQPKDTRTAAQKEALVSLLRDLRRLYPNAKIQGHRDFPKVNKACPSFDAKKEYSNL
jgi:N-acetylmuramoyl-L-alanine amidase